MSIRPIVTALVTCELVIIDQGTHNITMANCFSKRIVDGPPHLMPPFFVVATFVNGHGAMSAKLEVERLDTLETTYERTFNLDFAQSLQEQTAIFRLRAGAIPVHGHYQALIIADGELIAQKRFSIISKGTK